MKQKTDDKTEILEAMARWRRALEAKDVEGLTADYAPDAVLFDAIPPYKVVGVENIRKAWEQCLPHMPEFRAEHRDVVIHLGEDMAVVHAMHRFNPVQADHPCGRNWIRVTVTYRKMEGAWKVIHEHVSMPFNPMDDKIWPIRNLETLDTPDYGCAGQPLEDS